MITSRDQERARKIASKALKEGTITRRPCTICQEPKAEMHHDNYKKPLEIRWLCKKHHVEADKVRRLLGENIVRIPWVGPPQFDETILERIDPKKIYSLKDIREQKLIPWALHYQTLRRVISEDICYENILQAVHLGEGRLKRYTVNGANITKYLKKYGHVGMTRVRRPKHIWQPKQRARRK